jgi:hypothetical protein
MLLQELIGKTITNIFEILNYEAYGMDKGECFVELDNKIIIEIPYNFSEEVRIKELDERAVSIFNDLSDYPVYHVNKDKKSIEEIVEKYADKRETFFEKAKQLLLGHKPLQQQKHIAEYESYKVEYSENKLKYIKDSVIRDIITFDDDDEKGFLELDNGYFISETSFSMNGTGKIGINLYDNLNDITKWKGNEFKRISDHEK